MAMTSRVVALDDSRTEVTIDSDVVVSGILAQMGRGMIQIVSKKMLQEFVGNLTKALAEQAKEG
jgi:carbon monoxide dehydrogenase subunit G